MRSRKRYHEVLGVSSDASHAEVKRAYRLLAKRLHPDRLRDPDAARSAEERLKEINAAWNEYRLLVSLGGDGLARGHAAPAARPRRTPARRPTPPTLSDEERERRAREQAERVRRARERELDERYAEQHRKLGLLIRALLAGVALAAVVVIVALLALAG